jgi:hypothetical protein
VSRLPCSPRPEGEETSSEELGDSVAGRVPLGAQNGN